MVKKYLTICGLLVITLITYCNQSPTNRATSGATTVQAPSIDPLELNKFVSIDIKLSNLKWELFGTPEWSDITPSPTDFATVIITGETNSAQSFTNTQETDIFIPPNSQRNWLNQEQHSIIASLIEGKTPPTPVNCVTRTFKSPSNNEYLDGIECRQNNSTIIVIIIKQPSP